ncbi:hypothetical protein ACSBR2_000771 [Camellia fascicularis]
MWYKNVDRGPPWAVCVQREDPGGADGDGAAELCGGETSRKHWVRIGALEISLVQPQPRHSCTAVQRFLCSCHNHIIAVPLFKGIFQSDFHSSHALNMFSNRGLHLNFDFDRELYRNCCVDFCLFPLELLA